MRSTTRILFILLLLAYAQPMLRAASFDCALARSTREKVVCANPLLSAADSKLAAAYAKNRDELSATSFPRRASRSCRPTNANGFSGSTTFVRRRTRVATIQCLTNEYSTRLVELTTDRVSTGEMPAATIPWTKLTHLLASTFHPADLPQPIASIH